MTAAGRGRHLVLLCALFLITGTSAAVIGDLLAGVDLKTAVFSFQVSNLMLGLPAGACGVLLGWHRPGNRLGWLLIGCGTGIVVSAATVPLQVASFENHWPLGVQRTLSTIYSSWVLCQFLFFPLAVLFFPDGKLLGRRWRWGVGFIVVTFVVELFRFNSGSSGLETVPRYSDVMAPSWLATRVFTELGAAPALEILDYVVIFAAIWRRYRRGDEKVRRQLLWLLWSMVVVVSMIVLDTTAVDAGGGYVILALGLIGLAPAAMTLAVFRYEVLDIRLVWSRTVSWSLLTAVVLAVYFAVVAAADPLLHDEIPASAPAAVVVATLFHPVRMRLQHLIDSWIYGGRSDPLGTAEKVAGRMSTSVSTPVELLGPLRSALRLPYAELRAHGQTLGYSGEQVSITESIPLLNGGIELGELIVGVRVGQGSLNSADRSVLRLLAAPLALAIHTASLNEEVQRTAAEVSGARIEERSRLRRDLHDGLGPLLTGIAFHAQAAENALGDSADPARLLLSSIRTTADDAISEVRVLLDQLRPTSLDELGLLGAIEAHAKRLSQRADGSRLTVVVEGDDLPALAPVIEATVLRVVTEALNNVARHSRAERVDVEFGVAHAALTLSVQDDGGTSGDWVPGVGLESMAERVRHVGGHLTAEPGRIGGRVEARIPLVGAR